MLFKMKSHISKSKYDEINKLLQKKPLNFYQT